MTLLAESTWRGKVFSAAGGKPGGGTAPVVEPATGDHLGQLGLAGRDDVARAAAAPRPRSRTGPRLRSTRAPRCCAAPATCGPTPEEMQLVDHPRGRARSPGMAGFNTHVAAQECYEAATLPSALRQAAPERGAAASPRPAKVPVGVVGVIAPFNVAADPGHPFGRTGPGAGQRRAAQAGPATARSAAASASPGSSRRPGCRRVCCTCCPVGRTSARRSSPTRTCGSSRSPARPPPGAGSGEVGRPPPQAGTPRTRRQLRAHRARRRRPRPGGSRRRFGVVPAPGPDLHDRPAATWCTRRSPTSTSRGWPRRPPHCRSATRPPNRSRSARSSTPRQRDKVHDLVTDSVDGGRDAGRRWHLRGTVLPADRADRGDSRTPRRIANEVFGPVAPVMRFATADEAARAGGGHRLRAVARHPHPGPAARARTVPTRSRPASCTSTTRRSSDEARDPVRRRRRLRHRLAVRRRRRQCRRLHRNPVGHDARRDSAVPVLGPVAQAVPSGVP